MRDCPRCLYGKIADGDTADSCELCGDVEPIREGFERAVQRYAASSRTK